MVLPSISRPLARSTPHTFFHRVRDAIKWTAVFDNFHFVLLSSNTFLFCRALRFPWLATG
nr:MAG TPA: hypothetical protein [Caudoviricetes sp.]